MNLSKPEKTTQEIAMLKDAPMSSYPKCLLCEENVGYAGRVNHPATPKSSGHSANIG